MAIRDWSFSRLWAVTAVTWFVALGAEEILDYFDIARLGSFAIAVVPAFLAGAWAGTHPDIARWPRARLVAMWVLTVAAYYGATDYVGHWRAVAVILAAPATVLTLRWYELTSGLGRVSDLPGATVSDAIVTPPPSAPPKRLPTG